MKVVAIGAGSFVFGPSVLHDAILEHRIPDLHMALVDPDEDLVDRMAGVGRRMAHDSGRSTLVTAHTDRSEALDGADFVVCSAAQQMHRRFTADCDIIDREMPGHLVTEFGGIAGISYSLRQMALIEQITADMTARCPAASLLSVSNPLPRVCQAAAASGIRTVGFCAVSLLGYSMISRLFGGKHLHYPFAEAREKWTITAAGTNHLTWLVGLRDRATGNDLIPEMRRRLAEGASTGSPRADAIARETGWLLTVGDDHTRDFLSPDGPAERTNPYHGSSEERHSRLELLKRIGDGEEPWDLLLEHPSWEKPLDLVAARSGTGTRDFHGLNLANAGQIPNLPAGVFVETPCVVDPEGIHPSIVPLPSEILSYSLSAATVTNTIVNAHLARSRELLHRAIELDPTVLDKLAGIRAIDACLAAHADILPEFS